MQTKPTNRHAHRASIAEAANWGRQPRTDLARADALRVAYAKRREPRGLLVRIAGLLLGAR